MPAVLSPPPPASSNRVLPQYMHPDSAAHEGYPVVPPLLSRLRGLRQADLHINSGHNVDLAPAARVADLNVVLTLAHYEQEPFNRCVRVCVLLCGVVWCGRGL
jgi:hypothetical protein